MPELETSGEISHNLSAADRLGPWLREMNGAIDEISASLSAAGFDDFADNGPPVLWGIVSGGLSPADVAAILEISEEEVNAAIDTLISRGYLKHQPGREGHGRPGLTTTERAGAAHGAVLTGVRMARWTHLSFRPGDIVISTWPKTGTTWLQTICALLIFQTPELPGSLADLSVWPDETARPRDEVYASLDAQKHRRIIKSHLSLGELPVDPQATYFMTGRHPLDVELSAYHHNRLRAKFDKTGRGAWSGPESPHAALLDLFDVRSSARRDHLADMLTHMTAAWARRDDPNLVFVHYDDLSADLEGEMRRIADRLAITVPDDTMPSLVKAATFDQMRANADLFAPPGLHLEDPTSFFRSGISGTGRTLLTDAELARYHARAAQLAPPDLLQWLHRG